MAQQPMKKADLVATIAERAGCTVKDANASLNALADVITETVTGGGPFPFPEWASFRRVTGRPGL